MNGELPMLEARFLAHIDVERGLSAATVQAYENDIDQYVRWLGEQGSPRPRPSRRTMWRISSPRSPSREQARSHWRVGLQASICSTGSCNPSVW